MKPQPKRQPVAGTSQQRLTKAVTHIRLQEVNPGKLAALDALASVYLSLCQQYVTLFCSSEEPPDKFRAPCFPTPLSQRWQRVAIQQAAGLAQSWHTRRAQAYQGYLDDLLAYHDCQGAAPGEAQTDEAPVWHEWDVPSLRRTCIQANANVVTLEASQDSSFDYWLKISTSSFVNCSWCR